MKISKSYRLSSEVCEVLDALADFTQDAQFSVAVANMGITARTYTMRGDDVTSIHPFSSGTTPNRAKMEGWKTRWLTFINSVKAKGRKPVIIDSQLVMGIALIWALAAMPRASSEHSQL